MLAAMRRVTELPLDLYIEAPDDLGGFVRTYDVPEIVRAAAPGAPQVRAAQRPLGLPDRRPPRGRGRRAGAREGAPGGARRAAAARPRSRAAWLTAVEMEQFAVRQARSQAPITPVPGTCLAPGWVQCLGTGLGSGRSALRRSARRRRRTPRPCRSRPRPRPGTAPSPPPPRGGRCGRARADGRPRPGPPRDRPGSRSSAAPCRCRCSRGRCSCSGCRTAVLERDRPGQVDDAALGRAVGRQRRLDPEAVHRGHVHDRPAAQPAHAGDGRPGAQVDALQVHAEHPVPVVRAACPERVLVLDRRVRDDRVGTAVALRRRHQRLHLAGVGDVAAVRLGPPAGGDDGLGGVPRRPSRRCRRTASSRPRPPVARAIARPIPVAAPVTTLTLPCIRTIAPPSVLGRAEYSVTLTIK